MRVYLLVLILAIYAPALIHSQSESSLGVPEGSSSPTGTPTDVHGNGSRSDVASTGEVRTVYLDPRRRIEYAYPRTSRPLPPYSRRYSRYFEGSSRPGVRRYRPYFRRRRPYSRVSTLDRRYSRGRRRRPPASRRRTYRRRPERERPYYDPYDRDYEPSYDDEGYRTRRRYRPRPRTSRDRSRPRTSRGRDIREEYYPRYRDEDYRTRDTGYRGSSSDYSDYRDRRRGSDEYIEDRRRDTGRDRRRDYTDYRSDRRRGIRRGRRRDSIEYRDDRRRGSGRSSRRRRVEYDYFEDDPYIDERATDIYLTDRTEPRHRGLERDRAVDNRRADERPSDSTDYRPSDRDSRRDFQEDRPYISTDRHVTATSVTNNVDSQASASSGTTTQKTTESINPKQYVINRSKANAEQTHTYTSQMDIPDGFITNSEPNADSNSDVFTLGEPDKSTGEPESSFEPIETVSPKEAVTITALKDTDLAKMPKINELSANSAMSVKLTDLSGQDEKAKNNHTGSAKDTVINRTKTRKIGSSNIFSKEHLNEKAMPVHSARADTMVVDLAQDSVTKSTLKPPVEATAKQYKVILDTMNSRKESQNNSDSTSKRYTKPKYNVHPSSQETLPKSNIPINELSVSTESSHSSVGGKVDENASSQQRSSLQPPSSETVKHEQLSPVVSILPVTESDTSTPEASLRDERLPPRPLLQTQRDDLPLSDRDIPPHLRDERVSSRRERLRPSRGRDIPERSLRDERLPLRRRVPLPPRAYRERDISSSERSLTGDRLPPLRRRAPPRRRYRDEISSERRARERLPSRSRLPPPRRSYRDRYVPPHERPLRDERLPTRRRLPPPRRYRDDPPLTDSDGSPPERPVGDERLPPSHRSPPSRRYRDDPAVMERDGSPRERPVRDERPPPRRHSLPSGRYRDDPPVTGSDSSTPERTIIDERLRPRRRPPPRRYRDDPAVAGSDSERLPLSRRPPPPRRYRDDPAVTEGDRPPPERTVRGERPPSHRRPTPSRRYRDDPPVTGSDDPPPERRLPRRRSRPPPRRYRDDPPRRRILAHDRRYRDDPRRIRERTYRDEPPPRRRFRPRERTYRRRPRDRPVEETLYESSRSSPEGRYRDLPSRRDSSLSSSEGPSPAIPPATEVPPSEETPAPRTEHTETLRLGVVRARGGENGYPVHGGYGPGERYADGGLAEGVANGTGTGTLSAFLLRRLSGTNEDISAFKRDLRPVIATTA